MTVKEYISRKIFYVHFLGEWLYYTIEVGNKLQEEKMKKILGQSIRLVNELPHFSTLDIFTRVEEEVTVKELDTTQKKHNFILELIYETAKQDFVDIGGVHRLKKFIKEAISSETPSSIPFEISTFMEQNLSTYLKFKSLSFLPNEEFAEIILDYHSQHPEDFNACEVGEPIIILGSNRGWGGVRPGFIGWATSVINPRHYVFNMPNYGNGWGLNLKMPPHNYDYDINFPLLDRSEKPILLVSLARFLRYCRKEKINNLPIIEKEWYD